MIDNEQTAQEEIGAIGGVPPQEEIETWKRRRTQLRKQITVTRRHTDSLILSGGSRGAIKGLMEHLRNLNHDNRHVHTDLMGTDPDTIENDKQEAMHLRYVQQSGEMYEMVEGYLTSRLDDPASEIQEDPRQSFPAVGIGRQEREPYRTIDNLAVPRRPEEIQNLQERHPGSQAEAGAISRALSSLTVDDDERYSSVSQRPIPTSRPHAAGKENVIPKRIVNVPWVSDRSNAPDDWIDQYSNGRLPPESSQHHFRSSVSAELEVYHGRALHWFAWIDVFKALVHDTPRSPGEKIALLKRYLRGDCLDVIYGLGGGEEAYIEALVRLKQTCGRRDVMRAAHIQAIDRLELKLDPRTFKRYAEKIRPHLFDLTRIEVSPADVIERENGRDLEHRSLNDFGRWLCNRASAYQNAPSIAAEQSAPVARNNFPDNRRPARVHQGATTSPDIRGTVLDRPFCFKCEKTHKLTDCTEFQGLSIGERVMFCVRHHLCFCCFSPKHSVQSCPKRRPCKHTGCRYSHHEVLHDSGNLSIKRAKPSTARTGRQRVDLGMMRLEVSSVDGKWSQLVNVFIDEGSDSTLMTDSCARSLNIRGIPQILEVDGVGGEVRQHSSQRVRFLIRSETGALFPISASTMKRVANPAPVINWNVKKQNWSHLRDIPVGEVGGDIDVLVGMDHAHLSMVQEGRGGKAGEPVASRTQLGWIIRGVTDTQDTLATVRSNRVISSTYSKDLNTQLRRFCDTEEFGTEFQAGCLSPEDKRALAIAVSGTKRLDVGYQVPITWREGEPNLTNNYEMAINRWKRYASVVNNESTARYFLAHHGVYKGSKLRVVFDTAAPFKGKCLNNAIIAGPALQPSLAAVVNRFRLYEIAWAADIEAMGNRAENLPDGSSTVWGELFPFVAIHTIRKIMEDAGANERITTAVRDNIYVDDYLNSAPGITDATQEATTIRNYLLAADLKLQGWISNSPEFVQGVMGKEHVLSSSPTTHSLVQNPDEKVLGVFWNTLKDSLGFNVANRPDTCFTRVNLISKVASVFDPLGTASPLIVKAKIRLRELGVKGLKWTDEVVGDDRKWWEQWFNALKLLGDVEIPRCLFPAVSTITSSEIHTFCDASEEAYAAVVYIRNSYDKNCKQTIRIHQIKAANKLAPKKCLSVPKLELNAALLGARLAKTVGTSLPPGMISSRKFWTDSSTVRNRIRATAAHYQVFVSNRIGEIQTITEPDEWRFVPGALNPADAATRSTLDGTIFPVAWLKGPKFLSQSGQEWPMDLPWIAVNEEKRPARTLVITQPVQRDWTQIQITPELSCLPSLCQLDPVFFDVIKQCQVEAFSEELRRLKNNKTLHSSSSLLALSPILDKDGLLRLGGRIGRARLPYDQLHPVLLPGKHPLAEKIVHAFHTRLNHVGTDFLLCYIRQHFWMTSGRELVKKIRRDCPICRRNRARPGEQLMAELPESRLDYGTIPFTRTAVDLFGPLEISSYRCRIAKRWGVLYTCLVTRTIFLELVPSLSSEDFLLSLRRFIAMYRSPAVLHSDNGTNFVGAEGELREAAIKLHSSEEVPAFMHSTRIRWIFQPHRTPHFGGAHEALVKITKRALYDALEREKGAFRHPSEDVLRTVLHEVAGLLNTRPLTYASSDPEDFRPLTPNDFLNRAPTAYPPAGCYDDAQPRERYQCL
ncbi:uncharacterized protein LOC130703047 [Daphnia carinata]|uniref:uncharacterized protein LOC130703047 n=1 Tax=Daphnia carinata TaxID=120202 RepID=UPI0028685D65|nr:uncharacterized protein LOC130703047 [Daphnia carinata]